MQKIVCFLMLLSLSLCTSSLHAKEEALRFGIVPFQSPKALLKAFVPLVRQLEQRTGRQINLVSAPTIAQFNERAIAGEYDIIWPCNTCYVEIHAKAGYEAVAQGFPSFHGAVIVRKDSGISDISELKGKSVAAIGKGSYAGYQFFKNAMQDRGYTFPEDVSVRFLGRLDSIIFSVLGKRYDAGVIRTDVLDSPRFSTIRKELAFIETSIQIPQFPFAVKPGSGQDLVDSLVTVLAEIGETPEGKTVLKALKVKGFVACTDSEYDIFRKVFLGAR